MSDAPECQSHQVTSAVIVTPGRVVVEAETAEAAREEVERRGYIIPRSIVTTVTSRHHFECKDLTTRYLWMHETLVDDVRRLWEQIVIDLNRS